METLREDWPVFLQRLAAGHHLAVLVVNQVSDVVTPDAGDNTVCHSVASLAVLRTWNKAVQPKTQVCSVELR